MSAQDRDHIDEFEKALAELDFGRARELAELETGSRRIRMRDRIRTARMEATDRAEKLAARIQFLARADHYEGLLALDADSTTERLLSLLSIELHRGARLHLDGATRRQARFRSAARRHMKQAAAALVLLDTAKAGAELDKVRARWLTESQKAELAELRNQADQADAERLDLENRTAAVLREHAPDPDAQTLESDEGSVGKRRFRPGGCLGSVMLAAALVTLAAMAVLH